MPGWKIVPITGHQKNIPFSPEIEAIEDCLVLQSLKIVKIIFGSKTSKMKVIFGLSERIENILKHSCTVKLNKGDT